MEPTKDESTQQKSKEAGYGLFAAKRIAIVVVIAAVALWITGTILGFFDKPPRLKPTMQMIEEGHLAASANTDPHGKSVPHGSSPDPSHGAEGDAAHGPTAAVPHTGSEHAAATGHGPSPHAGQADHGDSAAPHGAPAPHAVDEAKHGADPHKAHEAAPSHGAGGHGGPSAEELASRVRGETFVIATIKPLDYELNERFWGWRPNDILDFTDNVNNFQLGVLEVMRRTAVSLAERISRTGSTAAFNRDLENAMNWLMVKATDYWFPSAETKYQDALEALHKYLENLKNDRALFYTRPDNLIPLLMAYEDLLGSCDDNLVKQRERDGEQVSHFMADDYFYYAKGVASAMGTILEAIAVDFAETIESRRGTEVLHHAIESCHEATHIEPWLVTNAELSGILANHRANIAAPISHARFYIGVLIKTLST